MTAPEVSVTGADVMIRRLRDHGVEFIFGYPGGQLTPLYDAIYREGAIRHILARDEQAAAFMADGYARATGRPGVCLAVCGPGVLNAATPLATAYTDSVPILLISGQIPTAGRQLRSGYYHENEQLRACETLTKAQVLADAPEAITDAVDRAFAALTEGRPGPVLLEIPLDVQRVEAPVAGWPAVKPAAAPLEAKRADIDNLARLVNGWQRPLILAGGGVISAGASAELVELAERLGAPVFNTAMGKGAFPGRHPLAAGMPWHHATSDLSNMASMFSPIFSQADGLLAIGCRFTQLATGTWSMPVPGQLAQIDIDPEEIGRHYPVTVGVNADAKAALAALLPRISGASRKPWSDPRREGEAWRLPGVDMLLPLERALPADAIVVADITRLTYIMLVDYPVAAPRTFLHPAGFVSMGYGLPAALGAKAAFPRRTVVSIVGDGCFLMCGMELATALQERLPIIVVLMNDGSLSLIKAIQQRRYKERFLGVDLLNPDFGQFAEAFGVRHWRVETDEEFEAALREAIASGMPALIDVAVQGL
jgi:acetolactate synthase-1/2/3 large subunit